MLEVLKLVGVGSRSNAGGKKMGLNCDQEAFPDSVRALLYAA